MQVLQKCISLHLEQPEGGCFCCTPSPCTPFTCPVSSTCSASTSFSWRSLLPSHFPTHDKKEYFTLVKKISIIELALLGKYVLTNVLKNVKIILLA
jgi:hypothetical protein